MIKKLGLTRENIVHYRLPDEQQAMLERKLSVNAFPSYILINKAGEIVDLKAPSPSQGEETIKAIEKLLE